MTTLLWIALAGAAGSSARYGLTCAAQRLFGAAFPWGTLGINVAGSFLMGLLMALGAESGRIPPTARVALTTGFLGGFTTYSTFAFEAVDLAESGSPGRAGVYVASSVAAALAAAVAGLLAGRALGAR